jgi:hypothetical protein
MTTIEKQFSAFFSSAKGTGSTQTNKLGNRFSVQLDTPLTIPRRSVYATLEVVSAKVWNVSPNISETIRNNRLYFTYQGNDYDVVLPDGLYGIDEMNMFMEIYFSNTAVLPNDLFVFEENGATQKLSIKFNYSGIVFDFTKANACIDVTGFFTTHNETTDTFTSNVIITSTIAEESVTAPKHDSIVW